MRILAATLLLLVPAPAGAAPQDPVQAPKTQRTELLQEPDFDAYFPDDIAGGKALDLYHANRSREPLGDDAYVALVRNGLRRTTTRKLFVLREFGNRFVWGKRPQRADAIELMFHAADPRPGADAYDTRHSAVYFGLSVTHEKTPRILDALVAIAMATENSSTLSRIAWGTADMQAEMLERLRTHAASEDPKVAEKARDLSKIFLKEESAGQRQRRIAIAKAKAEYVSEIPDLRAALREGTSAKRRAALDRIRETSLILIMERSTLADFEAAAGDPDPSVRRDVVRTVGGEWIWSAAEQHPQAIDLMLRMSRDEDSKVRYDSVYYGLSTVRAPRRDVVERLLGMLAEPDISDLRGRLHWGLRRHKPMVKQILLGTLRSESSSREGKVAAHGLYQSLLQEAPPVRIEGIMSPADLVGTWALALTGPGGRAATAELVIERRGDEYTVSSSTGMRLEAARLLVTQRASDVVAGAEFDGEGEGLVITLTLSGGNLEGVIMHAHERMLMPFTAARVNGR